MTNVYLEGLFAMGFVAILHPIHPFFVHSSFPITNLSTKNRTSHSSLFDPYSYTMTPNITASVASDKGEFYQDLEQQIQGVVDGQRNWVNKEREKQTLQWLFLSKIVPAHAFPVSLLIDHKPRQRFRLDLPWTSCRDQQAHQLGRVLRS